MNPLSYRRLQRSRSLSPALGAFAAALLSLSGCGGMTAGTEQHRAAPPPAGATPSPSATPPGAPWPMLGGSSARDGRAQNTAVPAGVQEWSVPAASIPSSAAIAIDGTVYFADSTGLHAIGADGTARWTLAMPGSYRSSPAIGADGTVYVGAGMDLLAVSSAGSVRWRFHLEGVVDTSPAVSADGTIYFAAADDHLHALGPDGLERWSASVGNSGEPSSPAIGPSGTVYVAAYVDGGASSGVSLFAVRADGAAAWALPLVDASTRGPVVAADDTAYLSGEGAMAVAPDGTLKWSGKGPPQAGLALAADGTLYAFGSSFGPDVRALRPDGSQLWGASPVGERLGIAPAVGPDGTIYIVDDMLHAFRPDGTLVGSFQFGAAATSQPAVGADGMVYVGLAVSATDGAVDYEVRAVRPPS